MSGWQVGHKLLRLYAKCVLLALVFQHFQHEAERAVRQFEIAVNLAAYELQEKFDLSISTPTTHLLESRSGNSASASSSVESTKSPDKS